MRRTLLLLLALLAVAGLATACSASGGGSDSSSAQSDGGSDGGEEQDEPDEPVTTEQLEGILPTAEEVGPDYVAQDPEPDDASDDTSEDDAFTEACPELDELGLFDQEDDASDEAVAGFETEDGREVEVTLQPADDELTEENLDAVIDALNSCGEIEIPMDEDGVSGTMSISAERTDRYGDLGGTITFDATVTAMGIEIPVQFVGELFLLDGVSVSVTATSGLDDDTLEAIPYDADVIESLSELMEERVGSL